MNHRIEKPHKLLSPDGVLTEPGWATKLLMEYNPFDVKAHKMRIKEWDYYVIVDSNGYAFSTTVADNRYMGLANANFFDFNEKKKHAFITPLIFPMGSLNMPTDSSNGDIVINKNTAVFQSHRKTASGILSDTIKNARFTANLTLIYSCIITAATQWL